MLLQLHYIFKREKLKGKTPVFRLTVEKQQHNNPSVLVHSSKDACSVLLLGSLVSSGVFLNHLKWGVSVGQMGNMNLSRISAILGMSSIVMEVNSSLAHLTKLFLMLFNSS